MQSKDLTAHAGVYIEKGMGLIIPGLTPETLGEIYEYCPAVTKSPRVSLLLDFCFFTSMLTVAVPISLGEFMGKKDAARIDSSARARALASH